MGREGGEWEAVDGGGLGGEGKVGRWEGEKVGRWKWWQKTVECSMRWQRERYRRVEE